MKRKEEDRQGVRSLTAMTVRLGALLLAVWLMCMGCLTVGTAQYVLREIADAGLELAWQTARSGGIAYLYGDQSDTGQKSLGIVEYRMLNSINHAANNVFVSTPGLNVYLGPDDTNIYRDIYIDCQTAAVFTDSKGQVIHQSGDFLYFSYVTADVWRAQTEEVAERGYGWIDLSDKQDKRYELLRMTYAGVHSLYDYTALRITGYFYGSRIEPLAIAILSEDGVQWAAEDIMEENNTDYVEYSLSALDAEGRVRWNVIFDRTASVPADKELVTIYALRPEMMLYAPGESFTFNGRKYDSLLAYLSEPFDPFPPRDNNSRSEYRLTRTTVFDFNYFYDYSDYDPKMETEPPEPEFILILIPN